MTTLGIPGAGPTVIAVTQPGPAAEGTTRRVSASCPGGTVLVGGGASTLLVNGMQPPSSFHVNASLPGKAAGSWSADGATGGQPTIGGATTVLALCAPAAVPVPTIVSATVTGPAQPATVGVAVATCPSGQVVVGGGGFTGGPSSAPSLHLIGSFPASASSWEAQAGEGGRQSDAVHTDAWAMCVPAGAIPGGVAEVTATVAGPDGPSSAKVATAACPAGSALLSGGARTGLLSGKAPQQGMHLTGSFPSDGAGRMTAAASQPVAWSARAETGGQGAPDVHTWAFALCRPAGPS